MKVLPKKFFQRDTVSAAEDLLGKFLIKKDEGGIHRHMITEVEAYDGPEDKASHASRGKTARNEIMFEEGGNWYVYLIYGMYEMLNITTGSKEYPAAVLIRSVEDIAGPGRLTRHLSIDRSYNKMPANKNTGLWIEDRGIKAGESEIETTPRVGVEYAEEWAKAPYRFIFRK